MELDDIIEMLANTDKPFMLAISKTAYRMDGGPGEHTLETRGTEVLNIFGDKDEAVAKLFDLCELYGWQI